ncbi:MAG: rRNA pseudouridine synthase [Candidatus Omnitrophica bacterium]|nr:rRNA pseudouridine synthase [Candidatus Omnitrophota bacterium]
MNGNLRLQVALAQLGFASRRGAAEIIKAARVEVNGRVVVEPGQRVNLEKDAITVDGRSSCAEPLTYLILNKPKGVVTTVKDKHAARGVLDLIHRKDVRIYPVGRLDKDTTGLLLLTNDGPLAYRLTHPKFGVKKVYQVSLRGEPSLLKLKELERGIILEGKKTYPCRIKVTAEREETTEVQVQLTEGRKRQIKKMFAAVGHPVLSIQRIGFGPLKLGDLKAGCWRDLTKNERAQLQKWN